MEIMWRNVWNKRVVREYRYPSEISLLVAWSWSRFSSVFLNHRQFFPHLWLDVTYSPSLTYSLTCKRRRISRKRTILSMDPLYSTTILFSKSYLLLHLHSSLYKHWFRGIFKSVSGKHNYEYHDKSKEKHLY